MNVKGLLAGAAVVAALGGCATYDDGYAHGTTYYGDGRYYSYNNDGWYRYGDGWRRWDGDRYYYRSGPDVRFGFGYYNQR